MRKGDKSNGTGISLNQNHCTIENRSGCTHPGAEHSAVRSRLMMRVVPGMLDRLGLSQSADGKNTEHQENRQDFEDAVAHQKTTDCD
jgi:hypothetical protein